MPALISLNDILTIPVVDSVSTIILYEGNILSSSNEIAYIDIMLNHHGAKQQYSSSYCICRDTRHLLI